MSRSDQSETRLVLLAQRNDVAAFEELLRRAWSRHSARPVLRGSRSGHCIGGGKSNRDPTKITKTTTDVKLPAVDSFPVIVVETYAYHARYVADPQRKKLYHPITLQRIMDGATISAPAYIEARRQMAIAGNRASEIFANVDVLVTPTTMVMPPKITDAIAEAPSEIRLIRNTVPFDTLGIPTISVPCACSGNGLPIGLQITGPRLAETRVLAIAHAYRQATEWHRRRPPQL